jgi:hypothetical protein
MRINENPNENDELVMNLLLLSECCGAISLGEVCEDAYGNIVGICSKCKNHATFSPEIEDD